MEVSTGIREEDGKLQVTVTVPPEETKKHVDAYFKELAKSRIPGFRPGRAPRKVLEQNFGGHEQVYAQITTDLINEVAPVAVDGQDVIFISDPEFDDEIAPLADGEPYTFTITGSVKPTLQLSSTDPVEITMPDTSATDAEVEEQITALQAYYYDIKDVDRPAQAKDYVEITMSATLDGEPVKALSSRGRLIELSSTALPASVDAGIIGMSAGETKDFDALIDEADGYKTLKGKTVQVHVTVENVRAKVLPPLDDAFAEQLGFESMAIMREQVHSQVEYQKSGDVPKLKERRCIDAIAQRVDADEITQEYIDYVRQDILREFFVNLQQQETTFDQFLAQQGIDADMFQADLDVQAKESAAQSLALDALFTAKGLELTDEEIDAEFEKAGEDVSREKWEASGRMTELREAMRRQKASEWLIENAVVTLEPPEEEAAEGEASEDEGEAAEEEAAAE